MRVPALIRHNAVSWIQQSLSQGHTLGRTLALASQLAWGGRHYSPRTMEGWYIGRGVLRRCSARAAGTKARSVRCLRRTYRRSSSCGSRNPLCQ